MTTTTKAWTASTAIMSAVQVAGSEQYTSDIDLETTGIEAVQVQITASFPGSTDSLDWWIYGSLDGSSYDTVAMSSGRIAIVSGGTAVQSILFDGLAHARLGAKRSGSTDSIATTMYWQGWYYSIA